MSKEITYHLCISYHVQHNTVLIIFNLIFHCSDGIYQRQRGENQSEFCHVRYEKTKIMEPTDGGKVQQGWRRIFEGG